MNEMTKFVLFMVLAIVLLGVITYWVGDYLEGNCNITYNYAYNLSGGLWS